MTLGGSEARVRRGEQVVALGCGLYIIRSFFFREDPGVPEIMVDHGVFLLLFLSSDFLSVVVLRRGRPHQLQGGQGEKSGQALCVKIDARGFQPPALFSALFVFCQAHRGQSGEHVLDSVLVGRV